VLDGAKFPRTIICCSFEVMVETVELFLSSKSLKKELYAIYTSVSVAEEKARIMTAIEDENTYFKPGTRILILCHVQQEFLLVIIILHFLSFLLKMITK